MRIKFRKTRPDAVTPSRAHPSDAGFDLVAITKEATHLYNEYDTGIVAYIPEGYVGLVYPRSSISGTCHSLANSVAVIDSGYTGSIRLRFRRDDTGGKEYAIGDKVAQLIVQKLCVDGVEEVTEIAESETDRKTSAFGSSGR